MASSDDLFFTRHKSLIFGEFHFSQSNHKSDHRLYNNVTMTARHPVLIMH